MAMTTRVGSGPEGTDGLAGPRHVSAVGTVAGPRRRRPLLVVFGLLMVAAAALAGAVLFTAVNASRPVLVAATDLEPGQMVSPTDVRVVELSVVGAMETVEVDQQDLVIGRLVRLPVPEGSLLHLDQVVGEATVVPEGKVVVGAALEPGAAPPLRAGDRVELIAVVSGASLGTADAEPRLLGSGVVWHVTAAESGLSGRTVMSLLVDHDIQADAAQAAADGRLRLALAGG